MCACLHEQEQRCGDRVCPTDAVCMTDHCVPHGAIVACTGAADATPCSYAQLADGVCGSGVCVAPGCGNGVVEPDEVCDGGPRCDADCQGVHGCPPIGTAPQFSPIVHEAIAQDCFNYRVSSARGLAVASCFTQGVGGGYSGPIDAPLAVIPALTPQPGVAFDFTSITPEGDELVSRESHSPMPPELLTLAPAADGTWVVTGALQLPFDPTTLQSIGAPSRAPDRRVAAVTVDATLHELAIDPSGNVVEFAAYTNAALGIGTPQTPNVSPDGLRMVFSAFGGAGFSPYCSDRASKGDLFGGAVPLVGAPAVTDPFLTEDCARLYFGAIQTVFYIRQI